MRNPFKFFIRDPSRIIFHYFHDTHPSSEVFFILTLFSLFLRFLSILSLVFSFFFLRALSLFYASTFSSHSTILSPFHGFPYPFSLLSRPHRFIIFRYTHPLLPPFKVFRLLPNTFHFDFSYDPSKLYFNQPDYDRSIDPVQYPTSIDFQFQFFKFYQTFISFQFSFQNYSLIFIFPEGWKIASENFQSRSFRLRITPRSSLDGNDRKLFRFLNELSRSRRRALYPFVCNTVRNTRMMARCRPIRARYRVTRAHTNTEREGGDAFNLAHLVPGLDTSRVVTRRGRKEEGWVNVRATRSVFSTRGNLNDSR